MKIGVSDSTPTSTEMVALSDNSLFTEYVPGHHDAVSEVRSLKRGKLTTRELPETLNVVIYL